MSLSSLWPFFSKFKMRPDTMLVVIGTKLHMKLSQSRPIYVAIIMLLS